MIGLHTEASDDKDRRLLCRSVKRSVTHGALCVAMSARQRGMPCGQGLKGRSVLTGDRCDVC